MATDIMSVNYNREYTSFVLLALLFLLLLPVMAHLELDGSTCPWIVESSRESCGFRGIRKDDCQTDGCCWDEDAQDLQLKCYQKECRAGFFGWGCKFQCHCKDGDTCDKYTGRCRESCPTGRWGVGCMLDNECTYNDQTGDDYVGRKFTTENGYTCGNWSRQRAYPGKQLPDGNLQDAGNFCRNPKPVDYRTWCYYKFGNNRKWDYCSLWKCDCMQGRWGVNCEKECHCRDANEECGQLTGTCSSGCDPAWRGRGCQECADGRFGFSCESECNCKEPGEVCQKSDGSCSSGCKTGFSGTGCQIEIPYLTKAPKGDSRSATSVTFRWRRWRKPRDGGDGPVTSYLIYYALAEEGKNAEWKSSKPTGYSGTVQGLKADTVYQFMIVPVHESGIVGRGSPPINVSTCGKCDKHFYDINCQKLCSSHCESDECDSDTGDCDHGYYGDKCEQPCNRHCKDGVCDKQTGVCDCEPGFHGDDCEQPCNRGCKDGVCDKETGYCECNHGYYGDGCEQPCSRLCKNGVCDKKTGVCDCDQGYYGDGCGQQCNRLCKNGSCDKYTGACTCESGHYGGNCDQCSEGCEDTCNSDNGTCSCKDGWDGLLCETEVETGGSSIFSTWTIGIIISGLLVLGMFVVVVVLVRRVKKQKQTIPATKTQAVEAGRNDFYEEIELPVLATQATHTENIEAGSDVVYEEVDRPVVPEAPTSSSPVVTDVWVEGPYEQPVVRHYMNVDRTGQLVPECLEEVRPQEAQTHAVQARNDVVYEEADRPVTAEAPTSSSSVVTDVRVEGPYEQPVVCHYVNVDAERAYTELGST